MNLILSLASKYISYIKWGGLVASWVIVAWSVHSFDMMRLKAQQAENAQKIANSIPEVITKTNTITKVIRDANDSCANAAIPATIINELR